MIALIAEVCRELRINLFGIERSAATEPTGCGPRSRRVFPKQLVDFLCKRDPVGGREPTQPVTRGLRHLDGRHAHNA